MEMEEVLKWQLEVTGVKKYHDMGYTGKGITVLCHEDSDHGGKAMQVLRQIAPNVKVIFASVSSTISGGKLKSYKWTIDGETYEFEEVMEKFKPDIISNSTKSPTYCPDRDAKVQPYIDNGDVIICTSAGNEGDRGAEPMYPNGLVIGACQFFNKKDDIRYVAYSGRTEGELAVDYVGFMWDWGGTSAATPFVAGQIALFMERYGKMSQLEFQSLIKPYCRDLGDPEKDWIYGDGLIVLPDDIEMEMKDMFEDVNETRWSKEDIEWCANNGIIQGFPDGKFHPEKSLTREQGAALIHRLYKMIENNFTSNYGV